MRLGYLSLTTFCPNSCIACPWHNKDKNEVKELSLDRIREDIAYAEREKPLDRVILSGGEPTWHSKFIEIMDFLSGCGFPVSLTTTSERFSDPQFLNSVLNVFPVKRLSVTTALHSFDPAIHDAMTNTVGSLRRWSEGLLAIEKAGVDTTLKHLLCRRTIKYLPSFIEEYYSRFTSTTKLFLCSLDFSGMAKTNQDQLLCSFAELREMLESALDKVAEFRTKGDSRQVRILDLPPCALSEQYHHFFSGTRRASSELAFYDAPGYDRNAPREHLVQKNSIHHEICSPCVYRETCHGTWNTALEYYAASFRPVLRRLSDD